jgi:hypothetical protein
MPDARRDESDSRYEIFAESAAFEYWSPERFDRLAFAMKALDRLRPSVTVIVYERRHFHLDMPLDLSRTDTTRAALIGIPPHASREQIVCALLEAIAVPRAPLLVAALSALR